jgi:hypothetical protein
MSDKPVKVKTVLNSPKFRLAAPCPTAKGKFSTLSFETYLNNPRIIVATNDPEMMSPDRGYGRIQAAMDMPSFYAVLEMIEEAAESPTAVSTKIENYGNTKGGDPKVPTHLTDVWIGKDAEGIVFLSVVHKAEGWPVIKFPFGPADERFFRFKHKDGTSLSKGEESCLYAKSYAKMMREVMALVVVNNYVHPDPYVPGQTKSGGYGGYNKPATNNADIKETELPF